MFMEKKLIFFDIDGTLFNENKEVPESTELALQSLVNNGHEVAIATGRAPFMYKQLREDLNIKNYISFNGQYVVFNNEVIYKNPIALEEIKKIIDHSKKNNHPLVYLDHEGMRVNHEDHPHVLLSMDDLKIAPPTYDPDYYRTREIYQALIFCEGNDEQLYVRKYDALHFIRWHQYSVDILPAGGSKAVGLKKMAEQINIPRERVVAFGDGLNDLEMLEFAGIGVAMGNAHPLAKEVADIVTDDVANDGIYKALKKINLI
jgi:Cof subfamily protein (haloacid dehalogenase superfamily)